MRPGYELLHDIDRCRGLAEDPRHSRTHIHEIGEDDAEANYNSGFEFEDIPGVLN